MSLNSGFGIGLGSSAGTYQSGPGDGNYPNAAGTSTGLGMPNFGHNAVVVGLIVIAAVVLLVVGVVGLRASGEIVI